MTPTDTSPATPKLPRRFLTLWGGQTLSLVGTDVAGLGIAFVAFLETGSLTWLAALFVAGRVPALLASSHAGELVDRTSAKSVLLVADLVAGVASMTVLALHLAGALQLWHLLVLAVVGSVANAYQLPAYQASVPRLVDPALLPRAHGLLQAAPAAGMLAGPALAGVLVASAGIGGILVFDLVTFVAAMVATTSVEFPARSVDHDPDASGERDDVSGSLKMMWHHLVGRRRGVRRLVIWMAMVNFAATSVNLLLPALLLTLTSEQNAGFVLAFGGLAMLASSAAVSALGLPERLMRSLIAGVAVIGVGLVLIALRPDLPVVVLGVVVVLAALPVAGAASGTINQTEVALELQGRLTAFRRVISESLTLPAVIIVTPLVEQVVEPAMQPGGWAADVVGPIIGVGEGRGLALAMIVAGMMVVAVALGMLLDPWLRPLDRRLDSESSSRTGAKQPMSLVDANDTEGPS